MRLDLIRLYIDQIRLDQIDRQIDRQVKNGKATKPNPQMPQKPQIQAGKQKTSNQKNPKDIYHLNISHNDTSHGTSHVKSHGKSHDVSHHVEKKSDMT